MFRYTWVSVGSQRCTPHALFFAVQMLHLLVSTEEKIVRLGFPYPLQAYGATFDTIPGTVLLHLFAGALARRRPLEGLTKPIPSLNIPEASPFADLELFVEKAVKAYNLDLYSCQSPMSSLVANTKGDANSKAPSHYLRPSNLKGGPCMREALQMYKDRFPQISAILIGTRRADPHGGKLF
jgi:hypothetical protein